MRRDLKVAYILHRFPYLTETFIMREMTWIREQGVELHIFSLLPPEHTTVHEQAKELLPYTRYSPFISWDVLKAQFYYLRRKPSGYLRALMKTIWQTYREPTMLLRTLVLFPKCVNFTRQIEELEIDHIHAHFVWLEGIAGGIASDLLNITFSIHPHAFGLFGRNQRNVRCELENASQVVTISTYHRAYIANLCPQIEADDIDIVHYGLNTEHFRPALSKAESNTIRILSVGRLIEKKGFGFLIDACALLADSGQDFLCQIAGAGHLEEALQTRINQHGLQKRVSLLGPLEQDRILELHQMSDIFALACISACDGDQDGMPNVLIEAMACEVPVITTPIAGIPDLVRDGETGLLVKEKDVSGLADALERLIVDPRLRRQLGMQARKTVMDEFQIQHNAAKLAKIFRRVSKQSNTTPVSSHVIALTK